MIFPYKEILSFFGHCHVTFPYMEPLFKVKVSFFSESFVQKTTQQSNGSSKVTSDSRVYTNYSKNNLFLFANTYEKSIVSKEYCIACHDDKMCFLTNCRYHNSLIGNIKDLQQKLDAFRFNYQHVDCLYTLFKNRFNGKVVMKTFR